MVDTRILLSGLWVALMLTYLLGDVLRIFAGHIEPGKMDGVEQADVSYASEQATVVLSDDRLLRKTAVIEGIRVIGTIGILIRATKASLLTAKKSVELLDELVGTVITVVVKLFTV